MAISRLGCGGLAVLAALLLLSSCPGPTYNPGVLKAIKTESEMLAASHPIKPSEHWVHVPESEWPPVIASLKPEWVTVYRWGVDIYVIPFFDGGWGYQVGRSKQDLPMLPGCYSEPSPGVFWHGPC